MEKTLAGEDSGVPDCCDSEYGSFDQVWRAAEEMSIGSGKSGKRDHPEGNRVCFRQNEGLDDYRNELIKTRVSLAPYISKADIYDFGSSNQGLEQQPVKT
jgi:hypothetical protein